MGYWELLSVLRRQRFLMKVFDAKRSRDEVGSWPAEPADVLSRVRPSHSLGLYCIHTDIGTTGG